MSLINEALKKVQRQRALEAAPLSQAPSGVAAAAVTTHVAVATRRRRSLVPLFFFGLGLATLGGAAVWLVMTFVVGDERTEDSRARAAVPVAPAATVTPVASFASAVADPGTSAASVVAVASASTAGSGVVAEEPLVRFSVPAVVAPRGPQTVASSNESGGATATITTAAVGSAPAPSADAGSSAPVASVASGGAISPSSSASTVTFSPAPASVPAVAPVAPVVTPVAAVPSDAEQVARVYAFLGSLRLSGVRGVGAQARVLMNEKVYRPNDIVDAELTLRLVDVQPGVLVFTDAWGRRYEKNH